MFEISEVSVIIDGARYVEEMRESPSPLDGVLLMTLE